MIDDHHLTFHAFSVHGIGVHRDSWGESCRTLVSNFDIINNRPYGPR